MTRTLSTYLEKYRKIQPDIALCYRSSENAWWNDRCVYLDNDYSDIKKYNHRMILENEVVIEFDTDSPEENKSLVESIIPKLRRDGIRYSLWHSGNKSYHLHFFVDTKKASNIRLLKKSLMRYYTSHLDKLPDLQLASTHMIRAEFGLHEKTGKHKNLVTESPKYPVLCEVPQAVWKRYSEEMTKVQKWKMSMSVADLANSELVKELLDTRNFGKYNDGRERIIFTLANILHTKYDKLELCQLLVDWYKYTNGRKLTEGQIKYRVYKAYKKPYNLTEAYIRELLEELKN